MRRIHLPDEDEHGWSFDPSSIEQLIEARLRREESAAKRLRERSEGSSPTLSSKRGELGLTATELGAIWSEAWNRFLATANLSDELREQRQQFREKFSERLAAFQK